MANPCFLKMGLNITWNVVNSFLKKTLICRKKLVCCFTSLVLYIFLKQPCMNVRYFVVNCALFWFWGYARETLLDRSKTWVDNVRFSTSILCTKKWLIITARRIDILGLNLTMNKVSTNCGLNHQKRFFQGNAQSRD